MGYADADISQSDTDRNPHNHYHSTWQWSDVGIDKSKPNYKNLRIRTAVALLKEGKLRSARVLLLQERGSSPSVLMMLGAIAVRIGRYSEGLEYLRQAERLVTDNQRVQTLIATCYLGLKKIAAARKTLHKVVASPNPPPDAYYYLALISRKDGSPDSHVITMLRQCADQDTHHGDSAFELGCMLLEKHMPDEAFPYLMRAAEIYNADWAAQFNVALAAIHLARFDVAQTHLNTCQSILPDQPEVLMALALCRFESNDTPGGIHYLRQLCSLSPSFSTHCLQLITNVSCGSVNLSIKHVEEMLFSTQSVEDININSDIQQNLSAPMLNLDPNALSSPIKAGDSKAEDIKES